MEKLQKTDSYKSVEKYFEWAKDNGAFGTDFIFEQEQLYIEWRRNNAPTDDDKLYLANKIVVEKGKRGGNKAIYIETNGNRECLSKQKSKIEKYIDKCEKIGKMIIEENK